MLNSTFLKYFRHSSSLLPPPSSAWYSSQVFDVVQVAHKSCRTENTQIVLSILAISLSLSPSLFLTPLYVVYVVDLIVL